MNCCYQEHFLSTIVVVLTWFGFLPAHFSTFHTHVFNCSALDQGTKYLFTAHGYAIMTNPRITGRVVPSTTLHIPDYFNDCIMHV